MAAVWRSQCAFARLFRGNPGKLLNNVTDNGAKLTPASYSVDLISRNYSSYSKSPFVGKIKERYDYDIVKNASEWNFVQRLLPFDTIPKVTPKSSYPSGWIPPKEESANLPYFVPRTKNHLLPIYMKSTYRGLAKTTIVRKIEGDIWLLNDEIKAYLKQKQGRYVESRVHELARFIEFKGDHVNFLKDWAYSKGF